MHFHFPDFAHMGAIPHSQTTEMYVQRRNMLRLDTRHLLSCLYVLHSHWLGHHCIRHLSQVRRVPVTLFHRSWRRSIQRCSSNHPILDDEEGGGE